MSRVESSGSERRRDRRVEADFCVQVSIDGKIFAGETVDLSKSGMRLHTFERFTEGANLRYDFLLTAPSVAFLTGEGEVVWTKEVNSYEHGIRFREMRQELRERLEDFLGIR